MAIKNFNAEKLILSTLVNDGAPDKMVSISTGGDLKTTAFSSFLTTGAVITDHALVRGDGGAQGLQDSGIIIDDSDFMTNLNLKSFTNDIYADHIHEELRNESGSAMAKGDAVYISGYSVGQERALVSLADASSDATLPCVAILADATLANNATGDFVEAGTLQDMDTSAWSVGDDLYVSNVGTSGNTLTNVKPTGTDKIQKVATVLRSHATLGIIEIFGAGRTNDIPNIANGNVWVGNGSGVPTETAFTFANLTSTPTTLSGYGISDTKANFNTALSDGSFQFVGDAPTSHTLLSHTVSGATVGHVPAMDSATTYSIRQLLGSEINNDTNWITNTTTGAITSDQSIANINSTGNTALTTKEYVDSLVVGGMTYKGGYNAATNTPALDTGSPVLEVGDTYTVTAAGTFFSEEVEIGDVLIAEVDSSDAAQLSDWTILQKNLDQAVIGPASAVDNRVVFFDGTSGTLIKDSGLTLSGSNTGDQTSIVGITGTKAEFDTACTNGDFMYIGDAPTAHTHLLAAGATDVNATAAELNVLDLSATALTVGWGYFADGASAASWRKLLGSEITNDLGWSTTVGTVTDVTGGTGVSSTGGATPSIALTVDELAEKTGAVVGADRLVGTSGSTNFAETISGIPLSIFNNDSGWTSNAGTVTDVTGGTGVTSSGGATPSISLDFSELTDMTGSVAGTTEIILQDGTTESRKAISEIALSFFNNDSSWISNITGETLSDLSDIPAEPTGGAVEYYLKYNDTGDVFTWEDITTLGGGDVTKVGTPVNDQIGVWTGDGTIEGTTQLTYGSQTFSVGVNDSVNATIQAFGNGTTVGGKFVIRNGGTADTNDDYYTAYANNGTYELSGNLTGNFLVYTSSTQVISTLGAITSDQSVANINSTGNTALATKEYVDQYQGDVTKVGTPVNNQVGVWTGDGTIEGDAGFTFNKAVDGVYIGVADSSDGNLSLYGHSVNLGGGLHLYNPADGDTNDDYYSVKALAGTFVMEGSITGDFFTYTSSTSRITMPLGDLYLGVDDVTGGSLHIYGDSGGGSGGKITLYNAGSYDTNDNTYGIRATLGDFTMYGGTTGDFFKYNSATQDIDFPDYGGGTVTGTLAYLAGFTSAGKIIDVTPSSVKPDLVKTITVENPGDAENIVMFYTAVAITVTQVYAAIVGTTSVTIEPVHGTNRGTATLDILSAPTAVSSTSGVTLTSFDDATIPAGSWVVLTTTAVSGAPTQLTVAIRYTED